MAYSGENVFELNVPISPEIVGRVEEFYEAIGWTAVRSEGDQMISVVPDTGQRPVDGIGYWQSRAPHKIAWFDEWEEPAPGYSDLTRGLRLPRLFDLVERPLIVPEHRFLRRIIDRGGDLLQQHTYVPLREHAGRDEIRFTDPFLFGIRIASPTHRY